MKPFDETVEGFFNRLLANRQNARKRVLATTYFKICAN